jgi:hypothetical protein
VYKAPNLGYNGTQQRCAAVPFRAVACRDLRHEEGQWIPQPGIADTGGSVASVNLGEAAGWRERSSSGLWKRSFTGGVVYLLEPGAATQTINLGTPMRSPTLGLVTSITLSAAHGAVLSLP